MCKKDKRGDIVKAALELLAEQGFHGAPMALIAEQAGVGAGTIYRYFENRDVLINHLYSETYERVHKYLLTDYPATRPVRERFFHILRGFLTYYKENPLDFRYIEQFHNSPYGLQHRKEKLLNLTGEYDFIHTLFEDGKEQQVIKDVPLALHFNLAFAPVVWALRDHHSGFLDLDDELADIVVHACWDSIKM